MEAQRSQIDLKILYLHLAETITMTKLKVLAHTLSEVCEESAFSSNLFWILEPLETCTGQALWCHIVSVLFFNV